ncbi:MAG: hypothetical protein ABSG73_04375 [Candidatus Aminicenantales bacterium]
MDKHPVEQGIEDVVKTYELLDRVRLGRGIVIRDDQFGREALLDVARTARSKGIGMSLLDTGRFEMSDLEWLIREKVRCYTSDEARSSEAELARILKACRASGSFLAYLHNGPIESDSGPERLSLSALRGLASSGMDVHLSNRVQARDFGTLAELAEDVADGRGYFVVYHHGPLVPGLTELASRGAWIHFSDRGLEAGAPTELGLSVIRAARAAGSRAAVYVQIGLPLPVLESLFDAGAVLLFQTPPSDRQSLQKPVEQRARRRKLPVRAYYLSTAFLP